MGRRRLGHGLVAFPLAALLIGAGLLRAAPPLTSRPQNGPTSEATAQIRGGERGGSEKPISGKNRVLPRQWNELGLQLQLNALDVVCHFTADQRNQVVEAGRADLNELVKTAEGVGISILDLQTEPDRIRTMFETDPTLPRTLLSGPFGSGSRFLRRMDEVLSNEQRAHFDAVRDVYVAGGRLEALPFSTGETGLYVNLQATTFDDTGLRRLARAPKLRMVNLRETAVTDAGLLALKDAPGLRALDLQTTVVTDAGLAMLRSLPELEYLTLVETRTTDEGLANVAGLKHLRVLRLNRTDITSDGLQHLSGLTELHHLNLNETGVGDEGLRHLRGLEKLVSLYLVKTQVSDAGIAHLQGLANLKFLELSGTQVTDAGLPHLAVLKKLLMVGLRGTSVTRDGVRSLLQSLPQTDIDVHPSLKR